MHNGGFNFAKEFYKIKKKLKCLIIEDACHALELIILEKKI